MSNLPAPSDETFIHRLNERTFARLWEASIVPMASVVHSFAALLVQAIEAGEDMGASLEAYETEWLAMLRRSKKADEQALRLVDKVSRGSLWRGLRSHGYDRADQAHREMLFHYVRRRSYVVTAGLMAEVVAAHLGTDYLAALAQVNRALVAANPDRPPWLADALSTVNAHAMRSDRSLDSLRGRLALPLPGERAREAEEDAVGRAYCALAGERDEQGYRPKPAGLECHFGVSAETALRFAGNEARARALRRVTPGHSDREDQRERSQARPRARLAPAIRQGDAEAAPTSHALDVKELLERIEHLDQRERTAVEALAEEGENWSAIARRINCSDKTAKAVTERAVRKLRHGAQ